MSKQPKHSTIASMIRDVLNTQYPVNYIFWPLIFIYVDWINLQYVTEVGGLTPLQKEWAVFIGRGGLFIIILIAAGADMVVEKIPNRWMRWIWASVLILLLVSLYVDVLLLKKTNVHLTNVIRLAFGNGWEQALILQDILGMRTQYIAKMGFSIIAIVTLGVVVLRSTWFMIRNASFCFRLKTYMIATTCFAIGFNVWAFSENLSEPDSRAWKEMKRVLPIFPVVNISPSGEPIEIGHLRPPFENNDTVDASEELDKHKPHPDIYLIVIESMRGDFLDKELTPNLFEFKKDCLTFNDTLAASNASHTSWFSLLTARHPIYFGICYRNERLWGSGPIQQLKNVGYQTHVFASDYLNYQNVDQLIFGKSVQLTDTFKDGRIYGQQTRPNRDRSVLQEITNLSTQAKGNRLMAGFLTSSHHDYFWPEDFETPYQPVAEMWNYYLNLEISESELELIKNRYRNSLHFTDQIIGDFLNELKTSGNYKNSIILITSDHGEAFLEHGKLVHASDLYREQTHVPFLFKLPSGFKLENYKYILNTTASHTDFLPTILNVIGMSDYNRFNGNSLLEKNRNFSLIINENGNKDPYEFCMVNQDVKAWFTFPSDSSIIALENTIYWTKITDIHDRDLPLKIGSKQSKNFLEQTFSPALKTLFH